MAKNEGHTSGPTPPMSWSRPVSAHAGLLPSSVRSSTQHQPGRRSPKSRRTATSRTSRKDSNGIQERRLLSAMRGQRRRPNDMRSSLAGHGRVQNVRNSFWTTSLNEWAPKWEDPKWKEMSEKMKANRGKESTHMGGSRSFCNHSDDLKEKMQLDDVPAHILFQHNHFIGHDMSTWVSPKAWSIEVAYQRELQAEKAKGGIVDENALFYKAVGGTKKGKVYRIGASKEYYYGSSSGSSVCGSSRQEGKSVYVVVDELQKTVKLEQDNAKGLNQKWKNTKGCTTR